MQDCWPLTAGRRMMTEGGWSVRVVYPGIRTGSSGPDYKDAVMVFGSQDIVRGDVELHLNSRDWHRHRHDTDPAYDGVILHVVGSAPHTKWVHCSGGGNVPVAVLGGSVYLPGCTELPCGLQGNGREEEIRNVLARAGVARFISRAARLSVEAAIAEPWKTLACRVARALGYSSNAETAESVGRRLISRHIHSLLMQDSAESRRVRVLGVAGLLPSQRRCAGISVGCNTSEWESWWRAEEHHVDSLSPLMWRMNGLYPNNSPVRRMVALADLWPNIENMVTLVTEVILNGGQQPRECVELLERCIRLPGPAYWRTHYDFDMRTRESDVLGGGKAREVVVNAVLPVVGACAIASGDSDLLEAAIRLYTVYPASSPNTITRHMCRQIGLHRGCGSAAAEQGALHIFTQHCRLGRCNECPLVGRWL